MDGRIASLNPRISKEQRKRGAEDTEGYLYVCVDESMIGIQRKVAKGAKEG